MPGFSCLLIGNDNLTIQCGTMLLESNHDIRAVVSRRSEIRDWAKANGIMFVPPGDEGVEKIRGLKFDWILSIANTDIISSELLSLSRSGAVNFHDGPLPKYAGLNAPVWAILNGETSHGITWHMIEGGVDEGDIVVQRMVEVDEKDTALTLNAKCFAAAVESFDEVMETLATGNPTRITQDLGQRTYYGLKDRPKGAAFIDFTQSSSDIVRLVRGLDHGDYRNPLAIPKITVNGTPYLVTQANKVQGGQGVPGTILANEPDALTVDTSEGAVQLGGLKNLMGSSVSLPQGVGSEIDLAPDADTADNILPDIIRGEPYWTRKFNNYCPAVWLSEVATPSDRGWVREFSLPKEVSAPNACAAFAAIISGLCDFETIDLAFAQDDHLRGVTSNWVPIRFDASRAWGDAAASMSEILDTVTSMGPAAADLAARCPDIERRIMPQAAISHIGPVAGSALTLEINGTTATIHADLSLISLEEVDLLTDRTRHLLDHLHEATPQTALSALPMLPPSERQLVVTSWNETDVTIDRETCIHQHFETRAAQTPDKVALVFEGEELTYSALDARANQIAHTLKDMGIKPGEPVGLNLKRSLDLVVAALGILKAGGAYLPLDPNYPADRLALFVDDSGAKILVTEPALQGQFNAQGVSSLLIDDPKIAAAPTESCSISSDANSLAYLIYTSGSTGKPKGVMIPHRAVSNFFTGMDARIKHDPPGVLMAVTSLSFDISVLELFWTLARGFKVVISDDDKMIAESGSVENKMDFSLFYWGNDDGVGRDKYALLLEGAQFADQNGFKAIWTPERHFHSFGGLYPNPSVTGAAVAAVTRNIAIRAGSCVAPLHHPARIAEEWAVIDNLTDGKVGIAIASGWQPDDFVLRPENTPPENKPAMTRAINDLRALWAGEKVAFPKADGSMHEVITQPRPVSKELPIWITTAGNPETWRQAGEMGANVLTHLLGQSISEVKEKIAIYHGALRGAGHDPSAFSVTLMLHTFIAKDRETAKSIAREPMKDYLRAAADLIKQYAWAFPAFKRPEGVETARQIDLGSLEPDELETILDFAFERYFEDSGLFGTVDDALARVEQVGEIGVTEIACLIDYGIERQVVLDGLRPLADVVRHSVVKAPGDDWSIAAQINRHKATHLQCTPYMAKMLVSNEASRDALANLKHLMIGGEALSGALVGDLNEVTDASIENMYGPTETTIWSTTERAEAGPGTVGIGRPIANTQVYVLNDQMEPCPVGVAGQLYIAGEGVALGYWKRDDLTAEKFLDDPFRAGNRMFKTGDLAKWRADGKLDFLGRDDGQVKIRGYRMELGEIEAALESEDGVTQAAVVVRPDVSGVGVLTAYITGDAPESALRARLAKRLPPFMVPTRILTLEHMPLTPNKKIDRNALKPPVKAKAKTKKTLPRGKTENARAAGAPVSAGDIEATIAAVWSRILGLEKIAATDNFFDLGGHSLLAVEAHREIKETLGIAKLSIADIFRAPTLGGLTARAKSLAAPETGLEPDNAPTASPNNPTAVIDKRRAMRQKRLTH